MDVISRSSRCSYTSPMWTPGITMIILILLETEPLRRTFPKVTQWWSGDSNPRLLALYLHCPLEFSARVYYICAIQNSSQ